MTPTSRAGTWKARPRWTSGTGGNARAFTFIEVLVALAIVSIALPGLLRLHVMSIGTAAAAQTMAQAVFLAQQRVADVQCGGLPPLGTRCGTVEVDGRQFDWRTDVTSAAPLRSCTLGRDRLRQLHVEIAWREGARRKSVEMTTYLADGRIHE